MAKLNEVSYDDYLKSRARSEKPDTALFVYDEKRSFAATQFDDVRGAIDDFYDSFFRTFQGEEDVLASLESVTPEQLHYFMTETRGLVTLLGTSGTLTTVISKSSYHLKLNSKTTEQVKRLFPTIPDVVDWKKSLNAPVTRVKTTDLLGTRLKGWRSV